MYKEFKGLQLPEIDKEILAFWEAQKIFQKSVEQRDPDHTFVFYEGPPSANGKPGIHHVMARTVKDLFCRYHTMKGKRVERKGGWDTHGLPIEISVEKELGITKEDIGKKISVEDYNAKCRETVMRYKDLWDDITRKMGFWVDLDDPYITFENDYIESVWYLLKQIYDKGLLYKGYTIQPYSPAAGTGLSSHELNQPGAYKDVTDTSAVAQFKVIRDERSAFLFNGVEQGDVFFLAWTTTPWTLPSNTALAVGADIDYVRVKTFNPYTQLPVNLILAEDLLPKWFKPEQEALDFDAYDPANYDGKRHKIPYRITGKYKGAEFEFISYEQLLPYAQPDDGQAFKVLVGDFVSTEEGTGIVHIAPSFGADDMKIGKKYGFGTLTLVDKQGKFTNEVSDFAGRYVKNYKDEPDYRNVDIDISIKLKKENKAFNVEKYSHNYPHCWRTDKPVLYYPLDSWFIRSTAMKDRMVELNKTINWKPSHTGEKRFGNWLENLQDWNLSRSRFWGIPLPIWRSEDGTEEKCIGSIKELEREITRANEVLKKSQKVPQDLHRPFIDDIVLVSDSGQPLFRETDLIDVWFDSGSMPYAQWHYPFENETKFKNNFPADFIAEGVDQTRGWFFTLHAIATMVFDSVAFRNVVSNGLVQDKHGQKMSKRLGNAVEPFETLATYGADATRWYMISNAQPWDNLKFDVDGIAEVRRKFFGTLYNTYSFFALYANIDGFKINEQEIVPVSERPEIDRWIISKLHSLIKAYRKEMDDYEPTRACRLIDEFVNDQLSNWYVRLSRRRFWKGKMSADKQAAYETLFECLTVTAQLMAPVSPFFADWLYRNLTAPVRQLAKEHNTPLKEDSIHLTFLVEPEDKVIDLQLEQRMDYAQRISSLVLSLRKKVGIRVRQPLRRILLPVLDESFKDQVDAVNNLILAEVNVKEIEYITDTSGIIRKRIKPNFKTLGRRLGKHMKSASKLIQAFSQKEITELENSGSTILTIEGIDYRLGIEDFEISTEDIPGWQVASDGQITVALDTSIDEILEAEGIAKELVNRIQNIRKSKGFNVTDKIVVVLEKNIAIKPALDNFSDYICNETLAVQLNVEETVAGEKVNLIDDIALDILVEQV